MIRVRLESDFKIIANRTHLSYVVMLMQFISARWINLLHSTMTANLIPKPSVTSLGNISTLSQVKMGSQQNRMKQFEAPSPNAFADNQGFLGRS